MHRFHQGQITSSAWVGALFARNESKTLTTTWGERKEEDEEGDKEQGGRDEERQAREDKTRRNGRLINEPDY